VRAVRADGADEAVELQVLLSHADDSQRSDPAYLAELEAWRREREDEGIPSRALPSVPVEVRGSSWVCATSTPARASSLGRRRAAAGGAPDRRRRRHRGRRAQRLADGRQGLGRLLLQATTAGLAVQPMTQVLEVPVLRARMRHVLGVVGHPQMLLRVGHGRSAPVSRRRPRRRRSPSSSRRRPERPSRDVLRPGHPRAAARRTYAGTSCVPGHLRTAARRTSGGTSCVPATAAARSAGRTTEVLRTGYCRPAARSAGRPAGRPAHRPLPRHGLQDVRRDVLRSGHCRSVGCRTPLGEQALPHTC
jgi:hypothetical protein